MNNMNNPLAPPRELIFDLDGTLIDSSESIVASLEHVLSAAGVRPAIPLTPSLIGPPLPQLIANASGIDDAQMIERLAAAFMRHYDDVGLRETRAYPGVVEGVRTLRDQEYRLFIVTNKRIAPTRKILAALGLTSCFTGVHSRDETSPAARDKAEVLRRTSAFHAIERSALFIGDTEEDAAAARTERLRFVFAAWGYGTPTEADLVYSMMQFSDLQFILQKFCNTP